jgi:hypothetical protein
VNIRQSIARSAIAFRDVVWPEISDMMGGGDLVPVEDVTDSNMADCLDWYAGIDAWLVQQPVMFGMASRVQFGGRAWDTFTVRASRPGGGAQELQKRARAIQIGALYPKYTVQAYLDGERLLSAAVVETTHLIDLCYEHRGQQRRNADGTWFRFVRWSQCDLNRIRIHYIQSEQLATP